MKNSFKIISELAILTFTCTVHATQLTPLRSRTPLLANVLKASVTANVPPIKQPVPLLPSQTVLPSTPVATLPQPMQPSQFAAYRANQESGDNGSWQSEHGKFVNKNAIKKALGITAAAAIGVVIAEATGIADIALKKFNMALFDEDLTSDEFSSAIVKIFSLGKRKYIIFKKVGRGSAFIVRSEKNPDLYFVLTAAHCVHSNDIYIQVKHPQHQHKKIEVGLMPILIDSNNDVAILLIPASEVKRFKTETGAEFPAIPAKQLSSIKPRRYEVLALQGYPGHALNAYRAKYTYEGDATLHTQAQSRTGIKLSPVQPDGLKDLQGTSGGPIISIRDNKPQIQAIICAAFTNAELKPTGPVLATGSGELPSYLQKAEEKVHALQEAEKKANAQKSWWQW